MAKNTGDRKGRASQSRGQRGGNTSSPEIQGDPPVASGAAAANVNTTAARPRRSRGEARGDARSAGSERDLRGELRRFASSHREGWGHGEWEGLLERLGGSGHDTSDRDALGLALERERLSLQLEGIQGMGPQRVRALADRYPRLWEIRQASVEELMDAGRLPRQQAERVKQSLA